MVVVLPVLVVVISGCSARSASGCRWLLVVVLLSSGAVGGASGCSEPGSAWKGHVLPSLGVILIRESSNTPNRAEPAEARTDPNRPETGQRGKQGKGARKLPIYIGVFRAFRSFRQKSKFRFGQHAL